MKTVDVAGAVIVKNDLIFVTQRGYGEFKDMWEFPGGKIEEGETSEIALKREIKEELDASIEIDDHLDDIEYDYPTFHLNMRVYICHLINPHLELLEHESARWIHTDELDDIDFLPADKLVLPKLKQLFKV